MQLTWPDFLTELERKQGSEASVDLECKGAFLRFRSRLIEVERPAACNAETARRFGVVPQYVILLFANGVRINLHLRHVEGIRQQDGGVLIHFRGEGCSQSSIALYSEERRVWWAG